MSGAPKSKGKVAAATQITHMRAKCSMEKNDPGLRNVEALLLYIKTKETKDSKETKESKEVSHPWILWFPRFRWNPSIHLSFMKKKPVMP